MRSLKLMILLLTSLWSISAQAEDQWMLIASPAKPAAIYACRVNPETGKMGELQVAADEVFTGFMAFHPTLPVVYAATSESVGTNETNGYVRAYRIDPQTAKLTFLNKASTADNGTTHIEASPNGKFVAVCHYSGKGTSVIGLNEDGTLKNSVSQIEHTGSSVHQRQKGPHPHGVAISQDSQFVCVADLGNDHVEVFRVTPDTKMEQVSFWKANPGAGPRHVSFHPNGKWLYCINELDSTISALEFDSQNGQLTEIETVSTLPKEFTQGNTTAEVVVHPNGQFLYGSNRGHNSTAVYQIDPQTGRLKLVEFEPTQGDHPRYIGLNPEGSLFVAANTFANTLVTFHVDPETEALTPTKNQLSVDKPMCVLFLK